MTAVGGGALACGVPNGATGWRGEGGPGVWEAVFPAAAWPLRLLCLFVVLRSLISGGCPRAPPWRDWLPGVGTAGRVTGARPFVAREGSESAADRDATKAREGGAVRAGRAGGPWRSMARERSDHRDSGRNQSPALPNRTNVSLRARQDRGRGRTVGETPGVTGPVTFYGW